MILEYSPDGNLLYVRLRDGEITETAEVQNGVLLDLDGDGRPLGLEFLNADDFFPFVRSVTGTAPGHVIEIPGALKIALDRRYGVSDDQDVSDIASLPFSTRVAATSASN